MAKGWRLTSSRSERLLGNYMSYGDQGRHSDVSSNDAPELEEEDVWSMVDDHVNGGESQGQSITNGSSYREWEARAAPMQIGGLSGARTGRRIPQDDRPVGGLSLAFDDNRGEHVSSPRILHQYRGGGVEGFQSTRGGRHMATSAPVNVPDWSKIYCVDSVESMHDSDDGAADRGESEIVPPHEYLAQEYRKMAAHSVFEGVGRTLKGRDMRRVRDAVWSQTGFDDG